ncbi:hypothetical protein Q8726_03885 [Raoultella ornithinolytica]|uniref:hypothetical protein n=1 Tax=Raoultella ornithinolytica TaxID=54291 RepID=UPI00273953B8|nr:hypothetical protein [Raoultella ornithinolytica]WLP22594.1 hypothetical protein Q8726_03885 [Raoultella ornithinolytica]
MKERGMIFNGEMVRAILDGRKTQTRRPIKWRQTRATEIAEREDGSKWPWSEDTENVCDYWHPCPFGNVGDRLWVRETFACLGNEDGCAIDWNDNLVKGGGPESARIYRASCEQKPGNYGLWSIPDDAFWKPHTDEMQFEGAWVPSIHMPRWASRITLEITDVRVERLNSISQEDAQAEGLELTGWRPTYSDPDSGGEVMTPYDNFAELWSSIYGDESWQANPWVWVIEFKVVNCGGD